MKYPKFFIITPHFVTIISFKNHSRISLFNIADMKKSIQSWSLPELELIIYTIGYQYSLDQFFDIDV